MNKLDTQDLFEIGPYDTWAAFTYDWDQPLAADLPSQPSHEPGHVDRLRVRSSKPLLDEDCDLFDPEVMDKFLIDVVESNNCRSNYASSALSCGILETEGTPPPNTERQAKAISNTSSPMTEVVIDIPGERRRAQNRAAQRAHRERQKRYVAQLEKRFFALQANYNHLDEKYKRVEKEYQSLIRMLFSRQPPTTSPVSQASTDSFLSTCSHDSLLANELLLCEHQHDQVLALEMDETLPSNLGVP
ncbi:uncharacterized protein A1O5_10821 [Cladophialophora psammophila CBS 110553]|uniref:BZIP domain-containing protein n=1 Tax=Cladophialophora psammophila CBS 110553 TaxID=1182543 RepID=W9WMG4_9EURO|nr:uncharacterized protein A1O5_10821 [Cladophialophora psammophila CBS 110553]EXJ66205.1 hypothetical protein A1O5_10821 [Cladophialophora psammophila CBS 110553]